MLHDCLQRSNVILSLYAKLVFLEMLLTNPQISIDMIELINGTPAFTYK